MTLETAKAMIKPGMVIEFKPQWLTTNAAYAKKGLTMRGKVIQLYEYHFLVQLKRVKECFCYTDIMTRHVRIIHKGSAR
jgi:uncharacterized protein Veg